MRQRGRRSRNAGLTVVPIDSRRECPAAPAILTADEAEQWRVYVAAMPGGWFPDEVLPLLGELCQSITYSHRVAGELHAIQSLSRGESFQKFMELLGQNPSQRANHAAIDQTSSHQSIAAAIGEGARARGSPADTRARGTLSAMGVRDTLSLTPTTPYRLGTTPAPQKLTHFGGGCPISPTVGGPLRRSPETIELDGTFTRREVADALKALAFDPRERSRRAILLDRDVRDIIGRGA